MKFLSVIFIIKEGLHVLAPLLQIIALFGKIIVILIAMMLKMHQIHHLLLMFIQVNRGVFRVQLYSNLGLKGKMRLDVINNNVILMEL